MSDGLWRVVDDCCKGVLDEVQTCGAVPFRAQGRVRALLDRVKEALEDVVPRESWWDTERAEKLIVAPILDSLISQVVDVEVVKTRNAALERDVQAANQLLLRFCETEIEVSEANQTCMVCAEGRVSRMCAATRYTRPRLMRELAAMRQHLAMAGARNASHQRYRPVFYDFFGYVDAVQDEQQRVASELPPVVSERRAQQARYRSAYAQQPQGGAHCEAPPAHPLRATDVEREAFVRNLRSFRDYYCVKDADLRGMRRELLALRAQAKTLAEDIASMMRDVLAYTAKTKQAVEFLKSTIDATNVFVMRCCDCLHEAVASTPRPPHTAAALAACAQQMEAALARAGTATPEESVRLASGFSKCAGMLRHALAAVVRHLANLHVPTAACGVQTQSQFLFRHTRETACQTTWVSPHTRLVGLLADQQLKAAQEEQGGGGAAGVAPSGLSVAQPPRPPGDATVGGGGANGVVVVASAAVRAHSWRQQELVRDVHSESACASWAHVREHVRAMGIRRAVVRAGGVVVAADPAPAGADPPDATRASADDVRAHADTVTRCLELLDRLWAHRVRLMTASRARLRTRKREALATLMRTGERQALGTPRDPPQPSSRRSSQHDTHPPPRLRSGSAAIAATPEQRAATGRRRSAQGLLLPQPPLPRSPGTPHDTAAAQAWGTPASSTMTSPAPSSLATKDSFRSAGQTTKGTLRRGSTRRGSGQRLDTSLDLEVGGLR